MTVIQIKRSAGSAAPTTSDLVEGELAYAEDAANSGASAILYIESVESGTAAIQKVGGKYYTDTVDAFLDPKDGVNGAAVVLADADGSASVTLKAPATVTSSVAFTLPGADGSNGHLLTTDGSGNLTFAAPASSSFTITGDSGSDTFSTGQSLAFTGGEGVDVAVTDNEVTISAEDASASNKGVASFNSTHFSVTAGAVSLNSVTDTLVNINGGTAVTALADADLFLVYDASETANRKITAEDVADYVYGAVSGDVLIAEDGTATIQANSVALGTDTTGNYVASITNGSYMTGGDGGSEGAGITLAVDATSVNTASKVVARDGSGNFAAGTITAALSGNATTASSWQTARTITLGGDLSGNVSVDGSADVTLTATIAANSVALGTDTTGDYVASVSGTANQIAVSGTGEGAAVSVALTDNVVLVGDLTVGGNDIKSSGGTTAITLSGANVTVAGNLTVSGTTTTVNSSTLSVTDPLIILGNDNNSSDAVDIGFYGLYDTSGSLDLYAGLFRDATDGKFRLFKDLQAAPTTTVNLGGTGYAVATLVANVEGNLTGGTVSSLSAAIAVGDGGTGATSFTSNGILFGNGSGAVQATAAGTDGYFLYSNAGTPAWTNVLDGGTY